MFGPGGLLLASISLPPFFQFRGCGWRKVSNLSLDVRNIFARGHILNTIGDALNDRFVSDDAVCEPSSEAL